MLLPPFTRSAVLTVVATAIALAAEGTPPGGLSDARHELFAARYGHAAELFRKVVSDVPASGDGWYGLVRADIGAHHSRQAYLDGEAALQNAPGSAGAETAAGLAEYRHGNLGPAEKHYRAALKIDLNYAPAEAGLATIFSAVSLNKSAREHELRAWKLQPDDPDFARFHADSLKGEEHIRALEALLAIVDSQSADARRLRTHIANDKALEGHTLRKLESPYEPSTIKLFRVMSNPTRERGVGVTVRLNGKVNVRLLLDTGASGIAISPKAAEKAGMQQVTSQSSEVFGIGDDKALPLFRYTASEVQIGGVRFSEYPVSVFRSAKDDDIDGLMGADVLDRFVITIDFQQALISLATRPEGKADPEAEAFDAGPPAPGFIRLLRFGNHLTIPTAVNNSKVASLFLMDSGASAGLIDTAIAKEYASVGGGSGAGLRGVQGTVKNVDMAHHVNLIFAGFRQEAEAMLAVDRDGMGTPVGAAFGGIVGYPALRNMAVTIDYREHTARFEYKGAR